jgi:thiol-disulfide isomerase/thioredoxin
VIPVTIPASAASTKQVKAFNRPSTAVLGPDIDTTFANSIGPTNPEDFRGSWRSRFGRYLRSSASTVLLLQALATFQYSVCSSASAEGTTNALPSTITIPSSEEDKVSHNSIVTMRDQSGWLVLDRKTSEGDLEWQVVLARITPEILPQVEVLTNPPGIKINYGPYFLRERLGFLRIFREIKTGEAWPWQTVFVPKDGRELAWGGSAPRIRGLEENGWCWVNSGPASHPDVCLRLEHSDFQFPGYGAESGAITRFFFGQAQVRDEGDLLIADRSLPDHVAVKQQERRFREQMADKPAPAISAATWLNSPKEISLEGLKGKVVLLDFWGQWCGPCVQKLPHSQALYEKYRGRGLVVIGIHSLYGNKNVERFVKQKGLTFPVALDNGETQKRYFVVSWPTYFLIDKRGILAWGFSPQPPADEQIEKLLK